MKYKVKFTSLLYSHLKEYLFDGSLLENGAFVLANVKGSLVFINEIVIPEDISWVIREENQCVPNSRYIMQAKELAEHKDKSLVFIHTHPNPRHPSGFSIVDGVANEEFFENLDSLLGGPLGSVVWSTKGLHGIIYNEGTTNEIESYTILGDTFDKNLDALTNAQPLDESFGRQELFMGADKLTMLRGLNIAVIGAGGIGSSLVLQLAKMGVGSLSIYDHDLVEDTNRPRVYGATIEDIGKPKVDIAKKNIEMQCDTEVKTYQEKVTPSTEGLANYDVIFCSVDNHTVRDVLNRIAYKYAVPLIDAACAIPVDSNGNVEQAMLRVNVSMPLHGCLWCSNVISSDKILQESLSENERQQQEKDGYLESVENQPSVIFQTSMVASLACSRLMNTVGVFSDAYSHELKMDLNEDIFQEKSPTYNSECRCRKQSPLN